MPVVVEMGNSVGTAHAGRAKKSRGWCPRVSGVCPRRGVRTRAGRETIGLGGSAELALRGRTLEQG